MNNKLEDLNYLAIVGAQRSGTTFLYKVLDEHPEIEMHKPVRPESKFFIDIPGISKKELVSKYQNPTLKSYIGEKCTSYLEYPEVGKRILKRFPKAKILVIIRNPVDRAISNYQFSRDNDLEKRTIEDVFINETPPPVLQKYVSVNPYDYTKRGFYYQYLLPYYEMFRDNLKVVVLEQLLCENIEPELYRFLDIPNVASTAIDKNIKINQTTSNQSTHLEEVRKKLADPYSKEIIKLSDFLDIDLTKYWNL
jgi:hypothetical protein